MTPALNIKNYTKIIHRLKGICKFPNDLDKIKLDKLNEKNWVWL